MLGQLSARTVPGGDGDGAGTNGFAAGDVARGISDDIDLSGREFDAMSLARA